MNHRPQRAMILAAGRGERMRPLTDHTPKPLLKVGPHALIEHHLQALRRAGFRDLVINLSHLGEQISAQLGDGTHWGLRIRYSHEPKALETGGGILQALPLLGTEPFLVINGDIWCDYPVEQLQLASRDLAHVVLVNNPPHHPQGDFVLAQQRVQDGPGPRLTFSGIGVYDPELFASCSPGAFPLAPVLRSAMALGRVGGTFWPGAWHDIGTPERLRELDRQLSVTNQNLSGSDQPPAPFI